MTNGRFRLPAEIQKGDNAPVWTPGFEQLLRQHCRSVDPADPIDATAPMALLGVDSLATLAIILEVEKMFAINIPDDLLTEVHFHSPGALWQLITTIAPQHGGGAQ